MQDFRVQSSGTPASELETTVIARKTLSAQSTQIKGRGSVSSLGIAILVLVDDASHLGILGSLGKGYSFSSR